VPLQYLAARLDRAAQLELMRALRAIIAEAPLFTPTMPRSGKPFSVRMTGPHRDEDEQDLAAPVLAVSLGDTAIFCAGGLSRKGPTRKVQLKSGDVVPWGGEDRLAYLGIDGILAGTSDLLQEGGRFNLTLRRVTKPN
jgi:alkylated DNA repair dioxygenase AlkB